MKHTEFTIEIYNPHGIYPKRSVICDDIAYLVSSGIPMLATSKGCNDLFWHDDTQRKIMLHGALLLTRKRFPCFSFHPFPAVTLFFKDTTIQKATSGIISVLEGGDNLDGLYFPFSTSDRTKQLISNIDSHHDIKKIRLINPGDYEISDSHYKTNFVSELYRRMSVCNRLVHIAIYYYVNCSRLMKEHFIEEAGLNLNLTLEAVILDFANLSDIKDKKNAILALRDTIVLPFCHMDFLKELYDARNEYLAHIDREMFTIDQNISDPDRYCYEHFESISWLLRIYINYRNIKVGKETQS